MLRVTTIRLFSVFELAEVFCFKYNNHTRDGLFFSFAVWSDDMSPDVIKANCIVVQVDDAFVNCVVENNLGDASITVR